MCDETGPTIVSGGVAELSGRCCMFTVGTSGADGGHDQVRQLRQLKIQFQYIPAQTASVHDNSRPLEHFGPENPGFHFFRFRSQKVFFFAISSIIAFT